MSVTIHDFSSEFLVKVSKKYNLELFGDESKF